MQLELLLEDGDAEATPSTRPAPSQRPKRRGFAALDPERRREISRLGGQAAHAQGTAHRFTSEEASAAGKKGGVAPHVRRGRQRAP